MLSFLLKTPEQPFLAEVGLEASCSFAIYKYFDVEIN